MKRRLLEAYDAMMMPDSCAQRIERELERQTKARQRRRNVEVYTPPRRSGWALAAGLVCLVLVLSAGGTLLVLNLSHPTAAKTPEPAMTQPAVLETTAADTTQDYFGEGISFRYPADWRIEITKEEDGRPFTLYDGSLGVFWYTCTEDWQVNLDLDSAGYQSMLRREGESEAVVTEVTRVSVDGHDANKVVYTWQEGTITRYEVTADGTGYRFFFLYYSWQQADAREEEALMASVRFGTESKQFVLSDRGRDFLEKMCGYMPDWMDDGSLGEDFWKDFLFASFTSPAVKEDGKVMTICGEADYVTVGQQGMVKISRETVEDYVRLAMGCDLPENIQPDGSGFFYEDGYYYIASSDFGSVGYTFREWEPQMDIYPTPAFARFDAYVDEPENVIGTVTFVVYPAENENGFTIIDKRFESTTQKAIETDRMEIISTAESFAQAYFYGNEEEVKGYLAESYSRRIETYGGTETVSLFGILGTLSDMEEKQVGDEQVVSYAFTESPTTDSFTYLTMELVKQEDGWKVKSYGLEK